MKARPLAVSDVVVEQHADEAEIGWPLEASQPQSDDHDLSELERYDSSFQGSSGDSGRDDDPEEAAKLFDELASLGFASPQTRNADSGSSHDSSDQLSDAEEEPTEEPIMESSVAESTMITLSSSLQPEDAASDYGDADTSESDTDE